MFISYHFVETRVITNFGDTCIDRDVKKGQLVLADGTVFEGYVYTSFLVRSQIFVWRRNISIWRSRIQYWNGGIP